MNGKPLIVIGFSARAAAFSAHRAGYAPYWIDHFGDEDLREQFPGQAAPDYPDGLVECLRQAPDAPFMFTGALENHPGVLEQLARQRPLLGNASRACLQARDPVALGKAWRRNNIPAPKMLSAGAKPPPDRNWLAKPLRGAGGMGIRPYDGQPVADNCYLQERLPGAVFSAVFIGVRRGCRLLGVTRQLVGLPEFHASPFSYCGSIGPVALSASERAQWQALGAVLSREFALTGLFGVDAVKRGDEICPVEVNPRYTASVEVLELGAGPRAVALHCAACHREPAPVEPPPRHWLLGKAYLFAPADLVFKTLPPTLSTDGETDFFSTADLPAQGARIKKGHPILTIIAGGNALDEIRQTLVRISERVYQYLF